MSRLRTSLRNIIVVIILSFVFISRSGLYLTPLSAHENSERSMHYGPSEIVRIEDFEEGKYILCKYQKWVSCDTVKKRLLFFWSFGNQVTGFENDRSKAVNFTWSGSGGPSGLNFRCYGIRNGGNVKKIELTLRDGKIFSTEDFYEDLFLITWKASDDDGTYIRSLKAYDENSAVIFEEKK